MKRLTLLLSLILTLTMAAAAQNPPAPQPPQQPQQPGQGQAAGPQEFNVEIVSTDANAKTITVKQGEREVTLPVDPAAARELANFKAGDKVTLTVVRDEAGKQMVSAIKKSEAPKP